MKPRLVVPLILTALLLALAAIASACGGDDGTDSSSIGGDGAEDDHVPADNDVPGFDIDLTDFPTNRYNAPDVMNGIYAGDYAAVPDDRMTRAVVLGLVRALNDECGEQRFFDVTAYMEYAGLSTDPSDIFLDFLQGILAARDTVEQEGDPFAGAEAFYEELGFPQDMIAQEGLDDGDLLVSLYGCDSDQVAQFRLNLDDFIVTRAGGVSRSGTGSDATEADSGSRTGASSSVPLYSSDVLDFSKGFVRGSGSQLEAANRELDRVIDSGQQVISCQYGPSDPEAQTGYQSYGFWYEDVPDNIDALLLVARDTGVPDPVFHLGTNSISSCPDTRDEGEAAWRAGRS